MLHLSHILLEISTLAGGILCLYAAVFLYEDEEAKIQNKLEDWWVSLADKQSITVSRHTTFMREVARLETQWFDRLLGSRLFSFRAICVSQWYALASMVFRGAPGLLAQWAFPSYSFPRAREDINRRTGRAYRFLPSGWNAPRIHLKACATKTLVCAGNDTRVGSHHRNSFLEETKRLAAVIAIVLVSYACDATFVALTCWSVRWASDMDHFYQIFAVITLNCLIGLMLFVGPALPYVRSIQTPGADTSSLLQFSTGLPFFYLVGFLVAALNEIDVIAAFVFVILAVLLLLDRLPWPVLSRPIYRFQAVGIVQRRKLFRVVGLALLSFAGINLPSVVREILGIVSP
jgi:hypothetical protein